MTAERSRYEDVPAMVPFSMQEAGVRIGQQTVGGPPMWFDNSSPPAKLTPGPRLPGFTAVTRDAEYTAYNDLDDPFAIHNLQYLPDITQADFDAIDLVNGENVAKRPRRSNLF